MSTPTMGDYQTAKRMAQKLKAMPPIDWNGKTVLDVGCDHGAWSKLASDHGASKVLGIDRGRGVPVEGRRREYVDLAALNNSRGWPNCEFQSVDITKDWPDVGRWDLVLCFSVYHHLYGDTADHDRIWRYLWSCTCRDGGALIWEGPVDTKDGEARTRHGMALKIDRTATYTKAAILKAASRYFTVAHVGPALHRAGREVWRCTPHQEPKDDPRDRDQRVRGRDEGVQGTEDATAPSPVRMETRTRNAQRKSKKPCRDCGKSGRARSPDGARDADRSAPVVARDTGGGGTPAAPGADRTGPEVQSTVSGTGFVGPLEVSGIGGRRSGQPDTSTALVIGGARCVWEDVKKLEAEFGPWRGLVIAVNDIGCHWPGPIDHWCTLHPEKMKKWQAERSTKGYPGGYTTWTSRKYAGIDKVIKTWGGMSSGGLAVTVAIDGLTVERVVLAGVPMEKTPHFAQSTVHQKTKNWNSAQTHWRSWNKPQAESKMKGKVRSMSGLTLQKFGAPDAEWLGIERKAA